MANNKTLNSTNCGNDQRCSSGCVRSKMIPPMAVLGLLVTTLTACGTLQPKNETALTDDEVRQYVDEWREVKPSIDRLSQLEGDLAFMLTEVSKMSDLEQVPGLAVADNTQSEGEQIASTNQGVPLPPESPLLMGDTANVSKVVDNNDSNTSAPVTHWTAGAAAIESSDAEAENAQQAEATDTDIATAENPTESVDSTTVELTEGAPQCTQPFANALNKSIAIGYFPRIQPSTSNAGNLHQVDQHLPMLLGANLKTRHGIRIQTQLTNTIYSAQHQGEFRAATQARSIGRENKSQFLITGEIQDMSLVHPKVAYSRGVYNKIVKDVKNWVSGSANTQSRRFSFQLQIRDGVTGQLIFDEYYQTTGNWEAVDVSNIGFGSAQFWQTDYGHKVQNLVAQASDSIANVLICQPFTAYTDFIPGTNQIVIHSGSNNGFKSGDIMELYRVVHHSIPGEFLTYNTSLAGTDTLVSLVNVYPSHSVANISNNVPETGQFMVMAP